MKKIALLLALILSVGIFTGCENGKGDLKTAIDNLNGKNNYYYELGMDFEIEGGIFTESNAQMTYYPGTGELSGEIAYASSIEAPYTASVYGVVEDGAYWNYVGFYEETGNQYQKTKLDRVPNMYNVNNLFYAVYMTGTNYAKGKREEISGNLCQQYVVSIPKEDSIKVLDSFGAIGDLQAMGADVKKIQEVLSKTGIEVEVWLDTVDKIPVRYRVDNTKLLKKIFTEMGMGEQAKTIQTCKTEMNVYGVDLEEKEVKVPLKMKNEAVDLTVYE